MPAGLLLIAARAVRGAGPRTSQRLMAALGLVVPVILALVQQPESSTLVWSGAAVVGAAALLGLPIFATLGAIALLLFWNAGIPVAWLKVVSRPTTRMSGCCESTWSAHALSLPLLQEKRTFMLSTSDPS